jgi:AcrR family transcriptional regulator
MTETVERKKADRGRPRSGVSARPDLTAREQIIDAAAHLFVERGYAATSTRAIADAVGIRQASLYYHFPRKEQILEELLMRTVEPSTRVADLITASLAESTARLHALIAFDAGQLFAAAYNLGTLYFLPEVRQDGFEEFRAERSRLRAVYASLIEQSITVELATEITSVDYLVDVVFGMVESTIAIRADRPDEDAALLVTTIARGCLRVLGHGSAAITAIGEAGDALLTELLAQAGTTTTSVSPAPTS